MKAIVLIPSEVFGKPVAEALLNTFGSEWELETYVITNQIIYDYCDERGESFLLDYRKRVAEIIRKCQEENAEDVQFFLLCGGNTFLAVYLYSVLCQVLGREKVNLLVYRKPYKCYGCYDVRGNPVKLKDEETIKPLRNIN